MLHNDLMLQHKHRGTNGSSSASQSIWGGALNLFLIEAETPDMGPLP